MPGLRTLLVIAAAATACVAAMAMATRSTQAVWHDAEPLGGTTLASGSLTLLAGDANEQVANYAFTALSASSLVPGSTVQAPLTVANGGLSPLAYRLAQGSVTGSPELGDVLLLLLQAVPDEAHCPQGTDVPDATGVTAVIYDGSLVGASTTSVRSLGRGTSETICVTVRIDESSPGSLQAAAATVVLGFSAEVG